MNTQHFLKPSRLIHILACFIFAMPLQKHEHERHEFWVVCDMSKNEAKLFTNVKASWQKILPKHARIFHFSFCFV